MSYIWGALLAILFCIDVVLPDPIPYIDEAVLGFLAITKNAQSGAAFFTVVSFIFAVVEFFLRIP